MLKMSPRLKMESPTCDYEKKTKTEKGHFKTLAPSGQCNQFQKETFIERKLRSVSVVNVLMYLHI